MAVIIIIIIIIIISTLHVLEKFIGFGLFRDRPIGCVQILDLSTLRTDAKFNTITGPNCILVQKSGFKRCHCQRQTHTLRRRIEELSNELR